MSKKQVRPMDTVQSEMERVRKRGNRKPSTSWGRLRHEAQKLRKLARRRGCQGNSDACFDIGFRALKLEVEACKQEREWNLLPRAVDNSE